MSAAVDRLRVATRSVGLFLQRYAGGRAQRSLRFESRDRPRESNEHRLAVPRDNRYAHRGRRDADARISKYFARFIDHFELLLGVVVRARLPVTKQVAGEWSREDRGDGALACGELALLCEEVVDGFLAFAARGLVGRDDDMLDASEIVERLQGYDQLNGRAVRVGDDAFRTDKSGLRIHLGNDQRHLGVHPPGARVVDDDRAPCHGHRRKLTRG